MSDKTRRHVYVSGVLVIGVEASVILDDDELVSASNHIDKVGRHLVVVGRDGDDVPVFVGNEAKEDTVASSLEMALAQNAREDYSDSLLGAFCCLHSGWEERLREMMTDEEWEDRKRRGPFCWSDDGHENFEYVLTEIMSQADMEKLGREIAVNSDLSSEDLDTLLSSFEKAEEEQEEEQEEQEDTEDTDDNVIDFYDAKPLTGPDDGTVN